jgi:YYY domain-containing protein
MEVTPILWWLVALAVLTVAGAQLAAAVFDPLPRRGAAFALPSSLLVVAVAVFWLGQLTYGRHTVVAGLLVVGVLSAVLSRYSAPPDWRAVAGGFGVFLLGFLGYLLYAAHSVTITPAGGEQFLHYGLTNALMGADALPPEDFWFAGEPTRYYYGTQLQVASLSLLSGVELRYGYSLGLATFYGVLFASAYGLVGSILASRDRSYRLGGALGAFFVATAGSLTTALRLGFEFLPSVVRERYGYAIFEGLVAERRFTLEEAIAGQGSTDGWHWFFTRYAIEGGLHEFPLYSLVKADLHGHALSTGYVVVAAAIAFSYYRLPADARRHRLAVLYGGLGLVAGVFGFMNTWSLPTAVGLAWLAVAAGDAHPATLLGNRRLVVADGDGPLARRLGGELWRLLLAGLLAVPVGLIGLGIAAPFLLGGVPTNEGIGVFPPQTSIAPFLVVYGALLALFAALVVPRAWRATDGTRPAVRAAGVAGLVAMVVLPLAIHHPVAPEVFAALGPLMLLAWWLVRTDRLGFEAVLLVAGLGLLLSMELVHARVWPLERVRWNTTLKVAVQGWTLAGAAAGAASALLVGDALDRLASLREQRGQLRGETAADGEARLSQVRTAAPAVLALALVVAVVLASLPFAVMLADSAVGGDPATYLETHDEGEIDVLAPHDRWKSEEMAALSWLDDQGSPTIVEAPGRYTYQWQNVASVFTDAVTVAGWSHQSGYRGTDTYDRRASAVEAVYAGPWENAVATLREYDVDYVYLGPGERETDRFEEIRDFGAYSGLTPVFENGAVTIYAVDAAELDADEEPTR